MSGAGARRLHSGLWILPLASSLFLIAVWAALAAFLVAEERRTVASIEAECINMARVLGEHTLRTVHAADQLGRLLAANFQRLRRPIAIGPDVIDQRAADAVLQVAVADATGKVVASNLEGPLEGLSIADREHFLVHRDADTGTVFVSKPVLGRVSKRWSIQVSRRINRPDGSFAGVLVVSLAPEYFSSLYKQVDLGTKGRVTLLGLDGSVRVRTLGGKDSEIGQSYDPAQLYRQLGAEPARVSGILRTVGAIDGVQRISAWYRVSGYPLVLLVGRDRSEALSEYASMRNTVVATAIGFTIAVIALTLLVIHHIRAQQRTARELERARLEAESASLMKSEFLASMSHELRTPLQSLLGFAELIARSPNSTATADYAGRIFASGDRLRGLLTDILDLAKLESGQMRFSPHPLALRPWIERIVAGHQAAAGRKGLALRLQVAEEAPERVDLDGNLVERIVGHLVDNAVKFCDGGEIEVRCGVGEGRLRVDVRDSGPGIPVHLREAIFERFRQGDRFEIRSQKGMGAGLALARELARMMGGDVVLLDDERGGAHFRVDIPCAVPASA